jgi:transcriptional regulator with XRE-family HTH domain
MPSPLGEKIRTRRAQLDISLDELATRTDTSKGYLWELENRDNPNPSADKLVKIAAALEVTPDFLLGAASVSPEQEVLDLAFFRRYQGLEPKAKEKMRKFLEWNDED